MNWQPIETAPKDGTKVMLWDGDEISAGFWSTSLWVTFGNPNIKGGWVIYEARSDTQEIRATHWMPLPQPPTPESE